MSTAAYACWQSVHELARPDAAGVAVPSGTTGRSGVAARSSGPRVPEIPSCWSSGMIVFVE